MRAAVVAADAAAEVAWALAAAWDSEGSLRSH